jgi:hypothetical protein
VALTVAILLEHDPEKWTPVFPRDKREAFARRSCSNKKMTDEHDSTQLKHALAASLLITTGTRGENALLPRAGNPDGAMTRSAITIGEK